MISMNRLFLLATDQMHQTGRHPPTIITDFSLRGMQVLTLQRIAQTHEQRVEQLLTIGRTYPTTNGALLSVAFVVEAWVAALKPGEELLQAPSEHPDRKECVLITVRTLTDPVSHQQSSNPIQRDRHGKFLRLERGTVNAEVVIDWLMDAFVKGYERR